MAIRVEHEVHQRRKGRNFGVGALLACFIGLIFALTVVKVLQLGDARQFENFDHVARPAIVPEEGTSE
ncbi:MAG: hypothetical protein KC448_13410 [Yoonia sp.]|nr:hypothetical protein [Yoonia sp.]